MSILEDSEFLKVYDSRTEKEYKIPIHNNSVKATDFNQVKLPTDGLDKRTQVKPGLRVFDRGFLNTACVESSITLIDGERGRIQYRDQEIDHLFENNDYEEVLHLLVWGHLPSAEEKQKLRKSLAAEMKVPQVVVNTIQSFPRDSLAFPMILAGLAAYVATDEGSQAVHRQPKPFYLGNPEATDAGVIRTLAAMATTIALVYCHMRGRDFTPADPEGSYIGNVLRMMGMVKSGDDNSSKVEKWLERLWILYADHEMTNSTAATLHAGSTLTDPISITISGMVSAYGPLHGGAIDLAYKQFEYVGSVDKVPVLIKSVKAKQHRLYGYGHRIYKTIDPRTKFIRQMIDESVSESPKARNNPLLDVALEIDRVASTDEYFTSRDLSVNADLFGALLYTSMGFEADIIVAMASLSRMAGVMAHWRESMQQRPMLWRPQQLYKRSTPL